MDNPLVGQVRKHPVYRDCSFVVTRTGSANFFGPDHVADAEAFATMVNGKKYPGTFPGGPLQNTQT